MADIRPLPTFPDEGVCQDNEPAHDRRESEFGQLSGLNQLTVYGCELSNSLNDYKR